MTLCRGCGVTVGHKGAALLDGLCGSCSTVIAKAAVKDSGHRREFDTGAVRDMAEGKGRYDLVPWVAIDELARHCEQGAIKYGERNCEKGIPVSSLIDSAFRHLSKYMQGMRDEEHLAAALWNIAFAVYHEKVTPEMQDIPTRMQGGSYDCKTLPAQS